MLLAAVGLAVSALTAVGFLTDRIGKAVSRQANEVSGRRPAIAFTGARADEWRDLAQQYDLQTAETLSFPSVVFAGDENALATIKVVSESYPLRGSVRVSDTLFGEQRVASGIPQSGEIWADGALLARVGADVGDSLAVGRAGP